MLYFAAMAPLENLNLMGSIGGALLGRQKVFWSLVLIELVNQNGYL